VTYPGNHVLIILRSRLHLSDGMFAIQPLISKCIREENSFSNCKETVDEMTVHDQHEQVNVNIRSNHSLKQRRNLFFF